MTRRWAVLALVVFLVLFVAGDDTLPAVGDVSPPPTTPLPPLEALPGAAFNTGGGNIDDDAGRIDTSEGSRHTSGSEAPAPEGNTAGAVLGSASTSESPSSPDASGPVPSATTPSQHDTGGDGHANVITAMDKVEAMHIPSEASGPVPTRPSQPDSGDSRADGFAATEEGEAMRYPTPSPPIDAVPEGDGGFLIEEEDGRHGLVEYIAPEDQAIEVLINMAGRGLSVVVSGALVGFRHARMAVLRAARRISRSVHAIGQFWHAVVFMRCASLH